MKSCLPRLFEHNLTGSLQILDACGDVRVARSLRRPAVALKVHGPGVEAIAGKLIHQGIVSMAGDTKFESGLRRNRQAVGYKQNRPIASILLRHARALAEEMPAKVATLVPILHAP